MAHFEYKYTGTDGLNMVYLREEDQTPPVGAILDFLLSTNDTSASRNETTSSASDDKNTDDDEDILKIPILVIIILVVVVLVIVCCCYKVFCIPNKNKRKIYLMMQEAKLESDT